MRQHDTMPHIAPPNSACNARCPRSQLQCRQHTCRFCASARASRLWACALRLSALVATSAFAGSLVTIIACICKLSACACTPRETVGYPAWQLGHVHHSVVSSNERLVSLGHKHTGIQLTIAA